MESHKSDWERVSPTKLGEGGQSEVYLVRTLERTKQRSHSLQIINSYAFPSTQTSDVRSKLNQEYVQAVHDYTRADLVTELGAMKEFKLRDDEEQSLKRLAQEIDVLEQNRAGLPKLLGSNIKERWMVTEYFSKGNLEDHLLAYKGKPSLALQAFRSVVNTVSLLHHDDIVHRDIKPANIFIGNDHELVLGDFGLVFVPDKAPRITAYAGETVGASDFIPPWGDMGKRLEKVTPSFDVYMLGKVLWCMVAGRPVLSREYFEEADNDVTKLFPHDPHAHMINEVLRKCVVEREKNCLSSANDLLLMVNSHLEIIKQGGQLLHDRIPRNCHVCGLGRYKLQSFKGTSTNHLRLWNPSGGADISLVGVEVFECDACHHIQFFRTGTPRI